jgi:LacI family transcriptional regulator
MRDVAAVAGVSLSTVSRVVNGGLVDAGMARRVHDAIEVLGYRPNLTASSLRRSDRASRTLGLVFEDVGNPFFSALHRGVEDVVRGRGFLTFAGSSDEDPARERELVESLTARGVDGLIVTPTTADHGYLLRDRSAGLALVFVDRPPRFIDADAVVSDNHGGAYAAVEHLIAHGHRRIGFLGDRPEVYTAAERHRGYRDALTAHGIDEDGLPRVHPRHRAEDAREQTLALLRSENRPTALFSSQNLITIEAIRALHELGLEHEVALVGFDDVTLSDAVRPGLTAVAQDPAQLGRLAAELLLERLDGSREPTRVLTVPTRLILRGSGELRPPGRENDF